jgi:glycosyltransferase involved in cell wall biosynthesis
VSSPAIRLALSEAENHKVTLLAKINVLQLICPTGFYGAERWILALARHLDQKAIHCNLAVTDENSGQNLEIVRHFEALGLPVHVIPMRGRFDPFVIKRLHALVKHLRIDILHSHGYKADILAIIVARLTGIKALSTPHGFENARDLKLQTFIKAGVFALRFFDAVAPLSVPLRQDLLALGIPSQKIHLILNGVDLVAINGNGNGNGVQLERNPKDKIVGYVGQLIFRKNVMDLIHAFDRLYQVRKDVQLWLIGDGEQRGMLENLTMQLSSAKKIHFYGYQADSFKFMRQFDVMCMTSILEGIPRALMEAMALGIPVLAYDIPGVADLVRNKKTGFLVPFGNREMFANYLSKILFEPAFVNGLTTRAQRYVQEKFSAARMACEYEKLYARFVDRSGKSQVARPSLSK